MDLNFNQDLAIGYEKNLTQISRVLTEDWMEHNMFCPICGAPVLSHYEANRPLADFFCDKCNSEFELKSKMSKPKVFNRKIVSGEYNKTIISPFCLPRRTYLCGRTLPISSASDRRSSLTRDH